MGACGRGPPNWTSKNRVQATVENAQRFQAGVGAHVPRMTSRRVHARGRRGSFHRPLRSLDHRAVGRGGAGERDEENGSPGFPRTNAFDLVHTWGTPLWEVYEAFWRTRGL